MNPLARLLHVDRKQAGYSFGEAEARRLGALFPAPVGERDYSLTGFLETRSLFVHVPKAAGTSVALALYGNLAGGHRTMADYQRILRPRALRSFFTFTFVRNPWDRVHSAYRFLKAGGWPQYDADYTRRFLDECDSFERFVLDILPREDAREKVHFHPQTRFLTGADGRFARFDHVGRFETFERDFDKVRAHVRPAARIEHRNRTHRNRTQGEAGQDYRAAYTPAMIDTVAHLYGDCIAALGYSFDGFSEAIPLLADVHG